LRSGSIKFENPKTKAYAERVINIRSKVKIAKAKPKKGTAKSVPRRASGYFKDALTSEYVAETNLFSRLIAKNNAKSR
jgi:hypothetical protein